MTKKEIIFREFIVSDAETKKIVLALLNASHDKQREIAKATNGKSIKKQKLITSKMLNI